MTNNHTADVGAIYRNILIDLPARGKGRKSGIEFQTCLRSTDCSPFLQTESGFIACKFTLGCKRWFYARIKRWYFSKYDQTAPVNIGLFYDILQPAP